jgi:hypothetical protein
MDMSRVTRSIGAMLKGSQSGSVTARSIFGLYLMVEQVTTRICGTTRMDCAAVGIAATIRCIHVMNVGPFVETRV